MDTNFLRRKFDQRNVYFPRSVFDKTFLKSFVTVFACKKVLAQVLSLERNVGLHAVHTKDYKDFYFKRLKHRG